VTHRALVPLNPIVLHSMLIGAAFRRYRKAFGIDQRLTARALGVSQSSLSKRERGDQPFSVSDLCSAVQQLNALALSSTSEGLQFLDAGICERPVSVIQVIQLAQVASMNCAQDGVTVLFSAPTRIKHFQLLRLLGRDAINLRLEQAYLEIERTLER